MWLALLLLLVPTVVQAQTAKMVTTWVAPTTNEDGTPLTDLAGYRVYWGTTASTASEPPCNTNVANEGKVLIHRWTTLNFNTPYYVKVTAIDQTGNESACSAEASATPKKPGPIR